MKERKTERKKAGSSVQLGDDASQKWILTLSLRAKMGFHSGSYLCV